MPAAFSGELNSFHIFSTSFNLASLSTLNNANPAVVSNNTNMVASSTSYAEILVADNDDEMDDDVMILVGGWYGRRPLLLTRFLIYYPPSAASFCDIEIFKRKVLASVAEGWSSHLALVVGNDDGRYTNHLKGKIETHSFCLSAL